MRGELHDAIVRSDLGGEETAWTMPPTANGR